MEHDSPLPGDFHNWFVTVVVLIFVLYAIKVVYQLVDASDILQRLSGSRAVPLRGMSMLKDDLQFITRQHFNQVLRMCRVVEPHDVAQHVISVHVHPESLEAIETAPGRLGVQFVVDSLVPCEVRLYWGVSAAACQALATHPGIQRPSAPASATLAESKSDCATQVADLSPAVLAQPLLTNSAEQRASDAASTAAVNELTGDMLFQDTECHARSAPVALPAGLGHQYRLRASDAVSVHGLGFELDWEASARPSSRGSRRAERRRKVPLAIAVTARCQISGAGPGGSQQAAEAHTEVTFISFRSSQVRNAAWRPEVLDQLALGDDNAHRILGIFTDEGGEESECQICYDHQKNVMLFPCRHCSICEHCLRSLPQERCPMCRTVFTGCLVLPVRQEE